MGRRLQDKHKELLSDPKYKKAFTELEDEFLIAKALIQARTSANLWDLNQCQHTSIIFIPFL